MEAFAYKIEDADIWRQAMAKSVYKGSALDVKDGFIHLSTKAQSEKTLNLHFSNRSNLVIAKIDLNFFGNKIIWETSRGGDLFPHIYADLPKMAVIAEMPIIYGPEGEMTIPREIF